ncbi:unnamed protein product [Clonostachys rhizophaga]|uniref:Uncharacterized protein n=1 Tax=Clonostachys rhizophaga TaxID=160324 RepID=A0A9N9VM40_9HYPO|nr:unnamed protein product [Clonostachys rhizophaga]
MGILTISKGAEPDNIIREIEAAESNFKALVDAAMTISSPRSLLVNFAGEIDITPLTNLVNDLIHLFHLFRRIALKTMDAQSAFREVPPNIMRNNHYNTLCPLTVFLRIIASALSRVNLRKVNLDDMFSEWGPIKPLRGVMVQLQKNFRTIRIGVNDVLPGFANCIVLHEEHSKFTVSPTAAAYYALAGINARATAVRSLFLQQLRAGCERGVRDRIEKIELLSRDLVNYHKSRIGKEMGKESDEWDGNPFNGPGSNRVKIGGFGASMTPKGGYKLACFVDFWRFEMERPAAVEERALGVMIAKGGQRGAWNTTSCAEWELWLTKLSHQGVQPVPFDTVYPVREEMAKSATWMGMASPASATRAPSSGKRATAGSRVDVAAVLREPVSYSIESRLTFPENGEKKPTPGIAFPRSQKTTQRQQHMVSRGEPPVEPIVAKTNSFTIQSRRPEAKSTPDKPGKKRGVFSKMFS